MPRAVKGAARRQSRKRITKAASGYRGSRKLFRLAKEAVVRAEVNARIGRKQKKRMYRGLWIIRLNAACKSRGLRYSQFIDGCKKAGITMNRKMLSEIAIADAGAFDALVEKAKAALAS